MRRRGGRGATQEFSEDVGVRLDGGGTQLSGWIGTARRPGQLRDAHTDESLNRIAVVRVAGWSSRTCWGNHSRCGAPGSWIVGEMHADFLDADDDEDTATAGRQRIGEGAPG